MPVSRLGLRVEGLGFGGQGSGFRILGLGNHWNTQKLACKSQQVRNWPHQTPGRRLGFDWLGPVGSGKQEAPILLESSSGCKVLKSLWLTVEC